MSISTKCTVTIDGQSFDAVSGDLQFDSRKDKNGEPKMGSIDADVTVMADFHDQQNVPQATLLKMFTLANIVDSTKIKEMKVVFWKDSTKSTALASFSFMGWISEFVTTNPVELETSDPHLAKFQGALPDVNDLLILTLTPAMSQQYYSSIQIGN